MLSSFRRALACRRWRRARDDPGLDARCTGIAHRGSRCGERRAGRHDVVDDRNRQAVVAHRRRERAAHVARPRREIGTRLRRRVADPAQSVRVRHAKPRRYPTRDLLGLVVATHQLARARKRHGDQHVGSGGPARRHRGDDRVRERLGESEPSPVLECMEEAIGRERVTPRRDRRCLRGRRDEARAAGCAVRRRTCAARAAFADARHFTDACVAEQRVAARIRAKRTRLRQRGAQCMGDVRAEVTHRAHEAVPWTCAVKFRRARI